MNFCSLFMKIFNYSTYYFQFWQVFGVRQAIFQLLCTNSALVLEVLTTCRTKHCTIFSYDFHLLYKLSQLYLDSPARFLCLLYKICRSSST